MVIVSFQVSSLNADSSSLQNQLSGLRFQDIDPLKTDVTNLKSDTSELSKQALDFAQDITDLEIGMIMSKTSAHF